MSSSRPLIGVTGPDRGGMAAWIFTSIAIKLQGGRATHITPLHNDSLEKIDGLVLGGGADIEPAHYLKEDSILPERNRQNISFLNKCLAIVFYPLIFLLRWLFSLKFHTGIDKERDKLEFSALKYCIENNLPVLGICRGSQLINIHFGGSLHQDLEEFYEETPQIRSIFPKKKINILPNTQLSHALNNQSSSRVNALHYQAIDDLGENLTVAARESANDIIQAIEHRQYDFMIGVQWHPEYLLLDPAQRSLFRQLVVSAKKNSF